MDFLHLVELLQGHFLAVFIRGLRFRNEDATNQRPGHVRGAGITGVMTLRLHGVLGGWVVEGLGFTFGGFRP